MTNEYIAGTTKYGHTADNIIWVVTEKVHGSNFAITFNGKTFEAAKYVLLIEFTISFNFYIT